MKESNLIENREQIKKLFNDGVISLDELIDIMSRFKPLENETKVEATVETKESIIDHMTQELIGELDIESIVDYMHRVDWKWGNSDMILEEVTVESFKKMSSKLIEETIRQMFNYIKNNPNIPFKDIEKEFSVATGGIKVVGYFETDGSPVVEIEFIADTSISYYTQEAFKKVALSDC